jgi:hypothetical protein
MFKACCGHPTGSATTNNNNAIYFTHSHCTFYGAYFLYTYFL